MTEIIKNVLRQKTPRLFKVAVCSNVHYTHKYRIRYFYYDNDFVPGEV